MADIYLVLRHQGSRGLDGQVQHRGSMPGNYPGVGGYGHDAHCHCLVVERQTYKTREEADAKAKELEAENPSDVCFSLEVNSPE